MRVGVLSDVHADLRSLERALRLLVDLGADRIVCLGDVVEKGPDGDAVVACLDDWLVPVVHGNHELNALRHAELVAATGETPDLSATTLARIARYPEQRAYAWEGVDLCCRHASPFDVATYLFAEAGPPKRLRRALRHRVADVVLVGHTHRPARIRYRDTWLLNPGSVRTGRRRDSHTVGLLSLPSMRWTLHGVEDGRPVEVDTVAW
jgi:putative phosphoesterase